MNSNDTLVFQESVTDTFDKLLGCPIRVADEFPSDDTFWCETERVFGTIGYTGSGSGTMVIILEPNVALKATEALTGMPYETLESDVLDTVAELTNIVSGTAKAGLQRTGLVLALPSVMIGSRVQSYGAMDEVCLCFECDWGKVAMKIAMELPDSASESKEEVAEAPAADDLIARYASEALSTQ